MDGSNFFRDLFNKIAGQLDGQDLGGRIARAAGAGAKAAAERGMQEFPHSLIKDAIENAYASIVSDELAERISMNIRSFDEEKIKDALDVIVAKLQEPETAAAFAKQLNQILKQADNDQIQAMIEQMIPDRFYSERMIFSTTFNLVVGPVLTRMRGMDEIQLAKEIQELAATLPTDIIAMQAGALTREFSPERILEQAQEAVGKLPSGSAIADIVKGVGESAVKHFDAVSKARSLKEAGNAIDSLKAEAKAIISGQLSADEAAKKKYNGGKDKGGSNFKF